MFTQTQLIKQDDEPCLQVFGPLIQFLVKPEKVGGHFTFMRCVVPAGVVIPLHGHPDPEAYYVLEGALEVLQHDGSSGYWLTSERGETVSIPGNVQHAIRNLSDWSAEILLISTPNIYEFFRELGKPVNAEQPPALPTPDDLQRLQQLSERYNYWLASPEENAAIGLAISKGA